MAMNLVRIGGASVLGIATGLVAPDGPAKVAPLALSATQHIGVDTLVAAGGLVLGGALQFLSPFTLPNLVDGVVDGAAAILLNKGTRYVGKSMAGPYLAAGQPAIGYAPHYTAPYALPSYGAGRGSLGTMSPDNRRVQIA